MESSKESLQKNCGVLGLKFSPHFLKGTSFFEALPVYFEAPNESTSSKRQVVIDKIQTLKDNEMVLEDLKLAGFSSFDEYMLCMVSDVSYIDDRMIQTTADVLKRNIWVVQSSITSDSYNLSKILKRFPNKLVKQPILLGCYRENCFIDLVYSDKPFGPESEGYSPLDCLINEVNLLESCEKLHLYIRVCDQLDFVDDPATGQTLLLAVADQLKLIKPLDYKTEVKKLSKIKQSEECFAKELQRDIWIVNGSGEITVVKGGPQKPHLLIGHCHGNQYQSLQENLLTQEEQEYSVPNDSFHKNYDTCTENDVACSTTSTTGDNNDGIFKAQQLMQLVYVDKTMQNGKTTHKFTLNPKALALKNVLPGKKNELIVVAMFGKTRLGKSSLLNMWCDLSTESFQILDTSDGCTKGIWMCHGRQDGRDIIVLDCQGSDDSDEEDSLDVKLALFCLQASTVMIVNHHGTLNRSLFDHLRFLSVASLRNKDLLKSPELALLLRDCHYKDIDHEKYRKKLEELKKKVGESTIEECFPIEQTKIFKLCSPAENPNLISDWSYSNEDIKQEYRETAASIWNVLRQRGKTFSSPENLADGAEVQKWFGSLQHWVECTEDITAKQHLSSHMSPQMTDEALLKLTKEQLISACADINYMAVVASKELECPDECMQPWQV